MSNETFNKNEISNTKFNEKLNENLNSNEYTKNNAKKILQTLLFSSAFVANTLVAQSLTDLDIQKINNYSIKVSDIKQSTKNDIEKVYAVNDYVNKFKYKSDQINYGTNDYYASPIEMIKKGAGDCEDFAMLKYNVLVKEFGMDPNKFAFVYGESGKNKVAHMILTYKTNGESYALDNTTEKIHQLDKHPSFKKIFEVYDNKVVLGNKSMELNESSKYSKLLELSLPTNFSNKIEQEHTYERSL